MSQQFVMILSLFPIKMLPNLRILKTRKAWLNLYRPHRKILKRIWDLKRTVYGLKGFFYRGVPPKTVVEVPPGTVGIYIYTIYVAHKHTNHIIRIYLYKQLQEEHP